MNDAFGNLFDELVDDGDCLEHSLPQNSWPKPVLWLGARVVTHSLESIEEQGECPLAVCAAHDPQEPLVGETLAQSSLDMLPSSQAAIVHPHQTAMAEGVAIILAQGALGGGSDVSEDQPAGGLAGDALEVGAVPGGDGRGEEAGSGAELGVGVEADAEPIGIVLASSRVLRTGRDVSHHRTR